MTLDLKKVRVFIMLTFLKSFKNISQKKMILKFVDDLLLPLMTFCYLQWPSVTFNDFCYLQWPFVTFNDLLLSSMTFCYLQWPFVTFNDLLLPSMTLCYLQWPFVTFNDLFLPSMTFEVILHFMKRLRLNIASIHRNFYQNWFINECARKKKAKIP